MLVILGVTDWIVDCSRSFLDFRVKCVKSLKFDTKFSTPKYQNYGRHGIIKSPPLKPQNWPKTWPCSLYNHATSNLAINFHETSQDKLSEALNRRRRSIIVIQVHDKLHEKLFISTCSFFNKWKWLRICLKKAYGEKRIYWKDIC